MSLRFSWESTAEEILSVYREVLEALIATGRRAGGAWPE
jgi:hypothetical protein